MVGIPSIQYSLYQRHYYLWEEFKKEVSYKAYCAGYGVNRYLLLIDWSRTCLQLNCPKGFPSSPAEGVSIESGTRNYTGSRGWRQFSHTFRFSHKKFKHQLNLSSFIDSSYITDSRGLQRQDKLPRRFLQAPKTLSSCWVGKKTAQVNMFIVFNIP